MKISTKDVTTLTEGQLLAELEKLDAEDSKHLAEAIAAGWGEMNDQQIYALKTDAKAQDYRRKHEPLRRRVMELCDEKRRRLKYHGSLKKIKPLNC